MVADGNDSAIGPLGRCTEFNIGIVPENASQPIFVANTLALSVALSGLQ